METTWYDRGAPLTTTVRSLTSASLPDSMAVGPWPGDTAGTLTVAAESSRACWAPLEVAAIRSDSRTTGTQPRNTGRDVTGPKG